MYPGTLQPILPRDTIEARRWEHTRLRRRLLEGTWEMDLVERLEVHLGTVRRQAWGWPDMSSNVYRQICRELAALYVLPPDVSHPTRGQFAEGLVGPDGVIARSGLWATMSRYQALVIGCREYWQRVHVTADGRVTYRPVPPDMTVAKASEDRPDYPVRIQELRPRWHEGRNAYCWTWDVLSIEDPAYPVYEVREAKLGGELGEDMTAMYLGGTFSGDAYPYRRNDGRPILPYVLYHAERIGDRLFDAWEGREVVEGSLNLAVMFSMLFHAMKDASWPQRYAVGARPVGAGVAGDAAGSRMEVIADPATVLLMEAESEQQPVIGQWQPAADVEKMEQTIAAVANRLAQDAGVSPADIQRMGGTARSGYAIALSSEAKRDCQRKYAQSFRASDEQLVMTTAILLNRATGTTYPEGGYSVAYRSIPLSGQELEARRKHALELMEAGLMTRIDAMRLLDDSLTEQDAVAKLLEIDAMTRRLVDEDASDPMVPADTRVNPAMETDGESEDETDPETGEAAIAD